MTVRFTGGTSGNREDAIFPMPGSPSSPQPILRTQTNGPTPSTVEFKAEDYKVSHREHATADVPTGGTVPGPNGSGGTSSTDLTQPDITGLKFDPAQGEGTIFRGATNIGADLSSKSHD